MIRIPRWLVSILIVILPMSAFGQSIDPVTELTEARRIYVPVEDLDVVIERDKQGVLLPRAKFDVLLTQAKANTEKNAVPSGVSSRLDRRRLRRAHCGRSVADLGDGRFDPIRQ